MIYNILHSLPKHPGADSISSGLQRTIRTAASNSSFKPSYEMKIQKNIIKIEWNIKKKLLLVLEQLRDFYYTNITWVSAEDSTYVAALISLAMFSPALWSLEILGFSFLKSNFVPTNNIGTSYVHLEKYFIAYYIQCISIR